MLHWFTRTFQAHVLPLHVIPPQRHAIVIPNARRRASKFDSTEALDIPLHSFPIMFTQGTVHEREVH